MKTLILVRHAKSSWKNEAFADLDRPLNNRGLRDAPFMGYLLVEKNVHPDLIVSSPALRALMTAKGMARELRYQPSEIVTEALLYPGDCSSGIGILRGLDDAYNTVMLVGHNPAMTQLANKLSERPVDDLPTCSIVCLRFAGDSWKSVEEGSGTVTFMERPKKYFR